MDDSAIQSSVDDDEYLSVSTKIDEYSAEILQQLGLQVERFRIDRRKLEEMIRIPSTDSTTENAEAFFQKVMSETATRISWPSKLKIGAKSKKDPHVKVVGSLQNIELAKAMILKVLDTKQKNRVTLKMDVSHSDHSYIIGKGGFKIQQVMEETGCHIHFPDSNRSSNTEKSNQVSIAGEADGVEKALKKIRDLLPLVYMFELPNTVSAGPGQESSPVLQHIQQTYSFNLAFKVVTPGRILVIVRGCHRLLERLRCGLGFLMEFLTGSKLVPSMGVMKTEVAVQHHSFVMGNNGANVQMIMNKTGATISFPDPAAPPNSFFATASSVHSFGAMVQNAPINIVPPGPMVLLTKTSVLIEGSFDSVCSAWDELLKSLPLSLIFDLREGQDVDTALINSLIERNKINIMLRPKARENVKSVIIRGAECESKILFDMRKEILGIQEPPKYQSQMNHPTSLHGMMPLIKDLDEIIKSLIHSQPDILGVLDELSPSIPHHLKEEIAKAKNKHLSNHVQDMPGSFPKVVVNNNNQEAWYKNRGDKHTNLYTSRLASHEYPPFLPPPSHYMHSSSSADEADSAYFSNWSTMSQAGSSKSSSLCSLDPFDLNDSKNGPYYPMTSYTNDNSNYQSFAADYGNKKMMATKAMYEPVNGTRTPTREWSGQGFSKSMPGYVVPKTADKFPDEIVTKGPKFQQKLNVPTAAAAAYQPSSMNLNHSGLSDQACALDYSPKPMTPMDRGAPSPFSLSNVWEKVSSSPFQPHGCKSVKDLQQLLSYFDLDQYVQLFNENEIDLTIFLTLTDIDLQHLNISYAARRRMLRAISALREAKLDMSLQAFKAAPGAERKPLYTRLSSTDN